MTINNNTYNKALSDPSNVLIIKSVCKKYSSSIPPDELKSCGLIGLWKCLQKHDYKQKTAFTSSLYRWVNWECLAFLRKSRYNQKLRTCDNSLIDNQLKYDNDNIESLLEGLPEYEKSIMIYRYVYNMTLEEIGKEYGYSKESIRKHINKTLDILRENGV